VCRRCGAEEETSADVLCECEALATLKHTILGSFFLDPEDFRSLILRAIWQSETSLKKQGCHGLDTSLRGTKVLSKAYVHRDRRGLDPIAYTVLFLNDTQKHIHIPHSVESSGLVIGLSQIPLLENTQNLQQTRSHAPGGVRTSNSKTRTAADPRLRRRGFRD